jgi:hypothetical protein
MTTEQKPMKETEMQSTSAAELASEAGAEKSVRSVGQGLLKALHCWAPQNLLAQMNEQICLCLPFPRSNKDSFDGTRNPFPSSAQQRL